MSRNQDCKNILIIGFGKIGKIKAYKWLSRGYEVYVKDLKFSSMKYLNTNSDVLDDLSRQYFTIEICTPTNHHLMLLKTVITRYVYSYISIEKPLCNRLEDLEEMKSLVGSHPHLAKKMFASEQYFFSKILEKLLQVDCFSLDKIKEITVNFSKDRIEDNENGRFLDKEILGYGIEIPHIIAVISYLGISLEEFKKGIFVNAIYIKDLEKHDYSIEILSCINQTVIKIISNLGSFAIREGKIEGGDAKTVRRVTIDDKTILFDPHPKLERYKSELVTGTNTFQIHDDMMDTYFYKLDKNELPTPRFTKMGGDIKVMVVRNDLEYSIRINFPLISKFFNNDIESQLYVDKHVEKIKKYIEQKYKNISFSIDYHYYLTTTGSCIDFGEEGAVGRGNKTHGIISSFRPNTMEAPAGKNCTYFVGKVWGFLSDTIAKEIYEAFNTPCQIIMQLNIGSKLYRPTHLFIQTEESVDQERVLEIVNRHLNNGKQNTNLILSTQHFIPKTNVYDG